MMRSGDAADAMCSYIAMAQATTQADARRADSTTRSASPSRDRPRLERHVIEAIAPAIDNGRYPVKRIMGESCEVSADIFRDGHEVIRAVVKWRRVGEKQFNEAPMVPLGDDRWRGAFPLAANDAYVFTIEAWTDRYASWLADFQKKAAAGKALDADLEEGFELLREIAHGAEAADRAWLLETIDEAATRPGADFAAAAVTLASDRMQSVVRAYGDRSERTVHPGLFEVIADRQRARFGAWYEMFPRSQTPDPSRSATLREAEPMLSYIAALGFDVVYLPPIHPIGVTNRKGPNNSPNGAAHHPGSPWAIGNAHGGHDAIDPALGTIADFDHFVTVAARHGLEVALDFAIQCSPDHPWVREHPEWFRHRPDGTIKYAENPPKEYQDIYPIDFATRDQAGLLAELRRVLFFWIGHGVRIFRVDNPHTKPVRFWEWLIGEARRAHPETIFLAEAFTRPKVMKALAKAGFSQSYTYFTWRNAKTEITDYLTELAHSEMREYFRPNFFANTPDILSPVLQAGGPPAFRMRLALAATLAPSYGIYSGYELCENDAVTGTEEYRNSEKYEIKPRNFDAGGNIREFVARINRIRRENPVLERLDNLVFLPADSDQILFYAKTDHARRNALLIAVNLDPARWHECTATVPPEVIGVPRGANYRATDLLTGASYIWGERNYIRLDPHEQPAHILRVDGPV